MKDATAARQLGEDDAALLVTAHLELLAAQVAGVTVLGSGDGAELVAAAHEALGSPASLVALTASTNDRVWLSARDSVTTPATTRNEVPAA
jgi:hypothetical protein